MWAGLMRERGQVGASCPGSRWEMSRRWAQMRQGEVQAGEGVGQAREGETASPLRVPTQC